MQGEKRRAVTAADLVILILIVILGAVVYRYAFASHDEGSVDIDYTVKVSAVRSELADRIKAGDEVYSTDGAYMGRVVSSSPATAVLEKTGQSMPGLYDLYITIEASATGDETAGWRIGWQEIYVERELELYTPGLRFGGVCISVN